MVDIEDSLNLIYFKDELHNTRMKLKVYFHVGDKSLLDSPRIRSKPLNEFYLLIISPDSRGHY